jgi:hypothetical protein
VRPRREERKSFLLSGVARVWGGQGQGLRVGTMHTLDRSAFEKRHQDLAGLI